MSDLDIERQGSCVVLRLDRPHRANSLSRGLIGELDDALAALQQKSVEDIEYRLAGVVITGGDRRFCGGADLNELDGTIEDVQFDAALQTLTSRIVSFPTPVAAAVEGACFGAAIDLAWSCDVVVLSRTTRIALPATRLGLLYNPASLARLHARLGPTLLRRLIIAGQEVSGSDIVGAGSGDVECEPGDALTTAVAVLEGAGGLRAATAATKQLLAALDDRSFGGASDFEGLRRDLLRAPERKAAIDQRKKK